VLVSRRASVAAAVGFVLATAAAVGVFAWAGGGEPAVDGEFVLDEPGEYREPVVTAAATGDLVPGVELLDATGSVRSLDEFRGVPMVVNIWYSSCAPCAREVRDFAEVHREVGDRIAFVGVNPLDDAERMTEFAADRDVGYTLLRDAGLEFVNAVPVSIYPTTLFVDPDGVIVEQTTTLNDDELREIITRVFPNA
jgi:peroxiredoxin